MAFSAKTLGGIFVSLGIILVIIASVPALAQADDVAVVVNPKNPVSALSTSALRKLFAGETRAWPGGTPVKLVIRAPGAREREVVLQLLHFSEDQYERYLTAQAYRGEDAEPVAVFSNGMEKEAVIDMPGAIALMDAHDVKAGLKVLKIDGKLPGDDGYPLH